MVECCTSSHIFLKDYKHENLGHLGHLFNTIMRKVEEWEQWTPHRRQSQMVQPQWGNIKEEKHPLCFPAPPNKRPAPLSHGSQVQQQGWADAAVCTRDGCLGSSPLCFFAALQTPDVFLSPREEGNHQQLFQAQGDRDLFIGASP